MEPMNLVRAGSAVLATAGLIGAQNLFSFLPAGVGSKFYEECSASPACAGARTTYPAPTTWTLPGSPNGAVAVDNRKNVIYATGGVAVGGALLIERRFYPSLGCPPGGGPLPPLHAPLAIGRITGMAVDPVNKFLFLTNGSEIYQLDPSLGMAIVCSFQASPMNTLSGLDYDPGTPGTIYGVSTAGEVARYALCGGYVSHTSPAYPWPGAEAVGLAIDKSDAAGGATYVLHANGEIYDHAGVAPFSTSEANQVGLSYVASPVAIPAAGACGGSPPFPSVDSLAVAGAPGFALRLCNIPANTQLAVLLVDFGLAPPFATCGGTWLVHGVSVAAPITGATAVVPLPLPGIPGARFHTQWATTCTGGCGFVLTDAQQIEISR